MTRFARTKMLVGLLLCVPCWACGDDDGDATGDDGNGAPSAGDGDGASSGGRDAGAGDGDRGDDADADADGASASGIDFSEPPDLSGFDLSGCDAIELQAPELGVQIQMPVFVPADQEREYCMLYQVPEGFKLGWSDGRYTIGSHHALIEKTDYTEIPTETNSGEPFDGDPRVPHPCQNAGDLWANRGVIAGGRDVESALLQERAGTLEQELRRLPDNVAVTIEAGDVLLINFHMINYTSEDRASCYKANLHGVPEDEVDHEAGVIFFYNPFITIPAGGTAEAHHACPITEDVNLVTAVSHMHERGVGYTATLWDGDPTEEGSTMLRELHSSTDWEDPDTDVFDPILELKAGQWIDWRCEYDNTEDRDISQGLKSTDEMCMFIGQYYPQNEQLESCGGGGFFDGTLMSRGTLDGEAFLDCFFADEVVIVGGGDDPARYHTLSCFTDACPATAKTLTPYLACLARADGELSECTAEQDAVLASTCD